MTVSYRQKAHELVDKLPDSAIPDLLAWIQSNRTRRQGEKVKVTRFTPVAMGGLWQGLCISDEDIATVRQQMWASFGETNG